MARKVLASGEGGRQQAVQVRRLERGRDGKETSTGRRSPGLRLKLRALASTSLRITPLSNGPLSQASGFPSVKEEQQSAL